MSGINKVMLVGHLGQSPEIRTLENDVSVTSFPLATSETISKNGERSEITEWHHVIMWRGLAEVAVRTLKKGQLIYLEGKLATRKYTDKDGMQRYTTEIIADKFTLLGRKSDFEDNESLTEPRDDKKNTHH